MELIALNGLSLHVFKPTQANGTVIVINSATGVKQKLYEKFSIFLSGQGYTVITYDYQGVGESVHDKLSKIKASVTAWAEEDFTSVLRFARSTFNPSKLIVIGHSIGGQIIGLSPEIKHVNGIVLIASQSGYWKLWSKHKIRMWLNWHLLIPPITKLAGYFPGRKFANMEDLPAGVALEWCKWCKSPNYLFDYFPEAGTRLAALHVPVVSYSFSDDLYFAPKKAVEWLNAKYSESRLKHKHIVPLELGIHENVGHFGFFRSRYQATLWNDLLREILAF